MGDRTRSLNDVLSDKRAAGFGRYRQMVETTVAEIPDELAKSVRMIELMTVATTEGGNEMGADPEATLIAAHAAGVAIALMIMQAFDRDGWGVLTRTVELEFSTGLRSTIRKTEALNPVGQRKDISR